MALSHKSIPNKNTATLGQEGEALAAEFLSKLGYQIVTRNFRTRFGEIDLICLDKNTLVFVEVRRRSRSEFSHPFPTVDARKQQKLYLTAELYLRDARLDYRQCRFDVIAIIGNSTNANQIEHLIDAFAFDDGGGR